MSKEKAKKGKRTAKKSSALLRLRKHTLEGVMIDYDKISKPLEHLKRESKRREERKGNKCI